MKIIHFYDYRVSYTKHFERAVQSIIIIKKGDELINFNEEKNSLNDCL